MTEHRTHGPLQHLRCKLVGKRELGELLRVVRDGAGAVVKLYVATYPLTRAPATFGESASS